MLNKVNAVFKLLRDEISEVRALLDEKPTVIRGINGKDGVPGADGKDGLPGTDGIDGLPGTDGRDGLSGANGIDGENGKNGLAGAIGAIGDKGNVGNRGEIGKQGKQGKQGKSGADGKSITAVEVGTGNVLSVSIDGVKRKAGVIQVPQSFGGGNGELNRVDDLGWDPNYSDGDLVQANTMVYAENWLRVSNKTTSDSAAVKPIGDEFSVYTGVLTEQTVLAKQVIFGARFNFLDNGYINGYRVDTVVGNEYEVFTVKNPTSAKPILDEIATFTGVVKGFQNFNITPVIAVVGDVFDLVVVEKNPNPTPVITVLNYDYKTPSNDSEPNNGEIIHYDRDTGLLRISALDNDGIDQTSFLNTLVLGDTIEGPNIKWSIQSVLVNGGFFDVFITPSSQDAPDGVFGFSFETVPESNIEYGDDLNFWDSSPNIQGLFIADGKYLDIVPNNNAYGVDLIVQHIFTSPDWNTAAAPNNGGSSSSGVENVRLEGIGRFETSADQLILGQGAANSITVNYGAGGSTPGSEFTIAPTGEITCNTTGVQYHFDMTMRFSRNANSGDAIMLVRLMYAADGILGNAIQLNNTAVLRINTQNTIIRENFEFDFEPANGSVMYVEVARDEAGVNFGDVATVQPTGSAAGWGPSRSAILTIERYIVN